ncbi:DUF899 domain-containing protein [Streptomyces sp. RLB3-17]|nr:DUF899 domain-containing protein [Streptomyces sp. RLB1-9]QDO26508.1 DUF899 domain-containing protein [Streptomyces sp. S1A1-8]QDO36619.1 DUF899 domain-containing protein [Streptomyces sp. S1A1-3]QDO46662.1 DUF899 domain-containing protein [Streptomyces sp. RLB3-17]
MRLLTKEKKLTRARDAMAADRRRMPWLISTAAELCGARGRSSHEQHE